LLLRELAAWARERAAAEHEQLDERWDRLAAGTLSREEEEILRAEAEGTAGGAAALAAFQPLGEAAEARIVAQIRAQRAGQRPTIVRSVASSPPALQPGKILPFRNRMALWSGGIGLAAAAVLIAVLVLPGSSGPLPVYTTELKSGDRTDRGISTIETDSETFSRGAHFDLVLRPASKVEGKVAVRCLLVASLGGGSPRPFPACEDAKRSADGSLHVEGTVGSQVAYLPGKWTLWAIVARPDELPDLSPVTAIAEPTVGKGWIRIPQSIRFGPAA
jgi:hypothetical protein